MTAPTESVTSTAGAVTYGGFHRPKGFGILGLGPLGSIGAGVASIITVFLIPSLGFIYAAAFAIVIGVVLAGLSIPNRHQMTVLDRTGLRIGFMRMQHAGSNQYLPGSLTHLGGHRLPGVLANSTLDIWKDRNEEEFTQLRYPRDQVVVIPFSAEPDGSSLVDPDDLAVQVGNFGNFLSSLAFETHLEQAAFTIESSQDPGSTLTRELNTHESPHASALSQQWAGQVKATYPKGGSSIRAYGSLSYVAPSSEKDMEGKKVKGIAKADIIGRMVSDRLPDILDGLNDTGAGTAHAMTAEEVIEAVRCAYNPGDRTIYDELATAGQQPPVMLWDSVGPSGAAAKWSYYEHSDGASITWEATGFISHEVAARALAPLLEPTEGVAIKRITFLYKPIEPAKSGLIAESNHRAAEGRKTGMKKPTARITREVDEADKIRKREAAGNALMDFAILVTITVTDKDQLPAARRAIQGLGPTARLHLHAMNGTQDSSFAQGLAPLGLITDRHLNIPTAISKGI